MRAFRLARLGGAIAGFAGRARRVSAFQKAATPQRYDLQFGDNAPLPALIEDLPHAHQVRR